MTLNCETNASPEAEYHFYFNGESVGKSTTGVLSVTVEKDGAYTCVPINTVGTGDNATVTVTVVGKLISRKYNKKSSFHLELFFCKKISLSRRDGYVMDGWISERCMYVTPIRLDLLLNINQISCCKGKWYVRTFDPDTVENGHIYSSVKE